MQDTKKSNGFRERIEFIVNAKGISKLWLSQQLGITKQAFNYMINHSIKPKYIQELAKVMSVNVNWLEKGIGEAFMSTNSILNKLPVYSAEYLLGNTDKNDNTEFVDYSNSSIDNFIAYKMSNDSAFPFMENTVLIFDKNKAPKNNDYVLLKTLEPKSILVRQYIKDGNDIYYRSKNPEYKNLMNIDVELLGVLVEARYTLY